jgi:type II secretory ATPase GspE/PulE/Tfp pilus assembly ATPase PilB-like protein
MKSLFYHNKKGKKDDLVKVIHTKKIKLKTKNAQIEEKVERADGIYEDIREVFPEDHQHAQEAVEDVKEQELEDQLLQEALQNGASEATDLGLDSEDFSETFVILSNV